jgi:hypothetical protein
MVSGRHLDRRAIYRDAKMRSARTVDPDAFREAFATTVAACVISPSLSMRSAPDTGMSHGRTPQR